ncbi:MAG: HAD hydrolase-like protein [Oscillospiraceae bacterium]|nr:HAD hydrolase-like protein [Oscillospiraceae bacterium]
MIHTVIFDVDGTLADSAVLTVAALARFAPEYGLPVPAKDAVKRATGYQNPEFYYRLFPDAPRDIVDIVGALVEQEELRLLPSVSGSLLFKDCRELLEGLRKRGVRLYIASTGSYEHIHSILAVTGIAGLFEQVCCGRPDKVEMLRELSREGGKDGYIMVGDMKKDCDGARANGMTSVGACWGYCLREQTAFDLYAGSPPELLKMMDTL